MANVQAYFTVELIYIHIGFPTTRAGFPLLVLMPNSDLWSIFDLFDCLLASTFKIDPCLISALTPA